MLIGENPLGELPGIGDSFSLNSKALSMDTWIIFTGSEPLEGGGFRYSLNRTYNIAIQKREILGKPFDVVLSNVLNYKSFYIDVGLKDTLRVADMSMLLVPSYESTVPSTSVLNALVWTWAETFDAIWRQTEAIAQSMKIETAGGTDLDNAWGQIYDMPRIYEEDDTHYRDRLKTRTTILTSSGTIANCEAIIDSVIGEESTTITSVYPASVRVRFDTDSAMRAAHAKKTLLESLIPQMLASGISYSMYLPFSEHYMDTYIKGPVFLPYNGYCAIRARNLDEPYTIDIISKFQSIIAITPDVTISKHTEAPLAISSEISKFVTKSISCGYCATKDDSKTLSIFSYLKKYSNTSEFIVDCFARRYNLELSHNMSTLCKKQRGKFYYPHVTIVSMNEKTYDMDILMRDPRATYIMKPYVKFQVHADPPNFYVAVAINGNMKSTSISMRLV